MKTLKLASLAFALFTLSFMSTKLEAQDNGHGRNEQRDDDNRRNSDDVYNQGHKRHRGQQNRDFRRPRNDERGFYQGQRSNENRYNCRPRRFYRHPRRMPVVFLPVPRVYHHHGRWHRRF